MQGVAKKLTYSEAFKGVFSCWRLLLLCASRLLLCAGGNRCFLKLLTSLDDIGTQTYRQVVPIHYKKLDTAVPFLYYAK